MNKTTMEKDYLQNIISEGLKNKDTVNCVFNILILKEDAEPTVIDLITRNGYNSLPVDTICGCWNLNDSWYSLDDVESIVTYCGVYPVHWDIDDILLLEKLYSNRDIYINVLWKKEKKNGKIQYIPNN